jgi:hypothetical protein
VNDVMHDTMAAPENGAVPGSGQCQVFTTDREPQTQEEIRRWEDSTERCPNRAEALIWYSCPEGHEYPEEVCSGHVDPPGRQWCGLCASDGLFVIITVTLIGWI